MTTTCVSCNESPCHPKCSVLRDRTERETEERRPCLRPGCGDWLKWHSKAPGARMHCTVAGCACDGFTDEATLEAEKAARESVVPVEHRIDPAVWAGGPGMTGEEQAALEQAAAQKELVDAMREAWDMHKRHEDRLMRLMARIEEIAGLPTGSILRG